MVVLEHIGRYIFLTNSRKFFFGGLCRDSPGELQNTVHRWKAVPVVYDPEKAFLRMREAARGLTSLHGRPLVCISRDYSVEYDMWIEVNLLFHIPLSRPRTFSSFISGPFPSFSILLFPPHPPRPPPSSQPSIPFRPIPSHSVPLRPPCCAVGRSAVASRLRGSLE